MNGFKPFEAEKKPITNTFSDVKVAERAILGDRDTFIDQSKSYRTDNVYEHIKELQQKESEGKITKEETAKLFELSLGIE